MFLIKRSSNERLLASALDSALRRRPRRNSADFTGHRALETPNCLPVHTKRVSLSTSPSKYDRLISHCVDSTMVHQYLSAHVLEIRECIRTLGSSAGAASISSHGDSLSLLLDVLEELDGTSQLPAIDSLGGLPGVLEGDSQVGAAGASRPILGALSVGGQTINLGINIPSSLPMRMFSPARGIIKARDALVRVRRERM